jgi:translation initiation factor IF-3
VNEQIRVSPVSVVTQDGEMMGEMPTEKAREMAAAAGLDLVEVAPDARPPVCRIMDFGRSKYQRKKRQDGGSKSRRTQLKQIRLRAKIDKHDIDFKVRQAEGFLRRKDRVKVNVLFRGRENAHHERGREILAGIMETLEGVSSVEQPPIMEGGRMMSMVLAPKS